MIDGSLLRTIGGYTEGRVLDNLSFWINDSVELGNQLGAVYIKRDRIRDSLVIRIVPSCSHQLVHQPKIHGLLEC